MGHCSEELVIRRPWQVQRAATSFGSAIVSLVSARAWTALSSYGVIGTIPRITRYHAPSC